MFKEAICVIIPLFEVTLCLLMLHSLRLPCFPFFSPVASQGEGEDLLVYTISPPIPLAPPTLTPTHVPTEPPITQV